MFSLHIDTARTWRGGQNQVLVTVLGLRALGHRTVLVAHSAGVLRQRAQEGLELIPLAPKTEMDLGAAWRLSRVIIVLLHGVEPMPANRMFPDYSLDVAVGNRARGATLLARAVHAAAGGSWSADAGRYWRGQAQ